MGIPEWEKERPSVEEGMTVYGIPYTPYQIRTGSYTKKDIQTMVAIHLSWEAMNYFGYQIA